MPPYKWIEASSTGPTTRSRRAKVIATSAMEPRLTFKQTKLIVRLARALRPLRRKRLRKLLIICRARFN